MLLSPPLHRAGEADLDNWASSAKPLNEITDVVLGGDAGRMTPLAQQWNGPAASAG